MTTSEPESTSNLRKLGDASTTRQLPKVQRLRPAPAQGGSGQILSPEVGFRTNQVRHVSVLFQYWLRIILAAVVVAIATVGIASTFPPSYSATSSLAVRFPSAAGNQMDAASAANTVASQIAVLTNSAPVLLEVATKLNISPAGLHSRVSGVENGLTNIVNVTATGANSEDAAQLAVATAIALRNYANNAYVMKATDGRPPASLKPSEFRDILATLPSFNVIDSNPVGKSSQLSLMTVGALGLIIGFFLAWEALYVFLNGKRAYQADREKNELGNG